MVGFSDLRRRETAPVAVCLLAVTGLVALGALDLLEGPTLIRAGFLVIGSLLALVLFLGSRGEPVSTGRRLSPGVTTKTVVVLAAGAVLATVWLGSRLLPLAVVLPVGFLLVAVQLRGQPSVPAILTQLSALFLAGRLGKYLTTGFYFGGSDTFAHVTAVDALVRANYTPALPYGYDLHPVFHFLIGAVTYLTGLETYDAIVLTGIALFTLVVPIAYLVGTSVFGSTRLGLLAALAVTVLEFGAYHAVYFYPQALAVVLLFVAVFVNARLLEAEDERTYRRLGVFVLALIGAMILTHHLTYVLLSAIVLVAIPVALLRPRIVPGVDRQWRGLRLRWVFPGVVGAILLLAYLAYTPSIVVVGITQLTLGVLFDVVAIPAAQLFTYGVQLPVDTIGRAVEWLVTPTGLYASCLGSLLLLGAYELFENSRAYRRGFTLAATGLCLSVLLLPLPIPIPQIERLKFVVVLVAVFPLAIGLERALSVEPRFAVVAVLLVATLGGATAFTALSADDMEGVYIEERREQVSMTESEFRAVQTASAFIDSYAEDDVATDRVTSRAFETTGLNATGRLRAGDTGLSTDAGHLVVRDGWTDHLVALGRGLRSGELNLFTVSRQRFERTDQRLNRVYATDEVAVYHSSDGYAGLYGTNETARESRLRSRYSTE